jgi:hypothetical protein
VKRDLTGSTALTAYLDAGPTGHTIADSAAHLGEGVGVEDLAFVISDLTDIRRQFGIETSAFVADNSWKTPIWGPTKIVGIGCHNPTTRYVARGEEPRNRTPNRCA